MSKWICECCENSISQGDDYIKDDDGRYCKNCYYSDTVTNYFIGGEFVGTTDDIKEYDSSDLEGVTDAEN